MPEEAPLPELPPDIKFRLDARDRVLAHLRDGRYFPLKHPAVQALLFRHLRKVKGRDPKRRDMRTINQLCTAAAVDFRMDIAPDATVRDLRRYLLDDFMERETVIPAVRIFLRDCLVARKLPWRGKLTDLRYELEAVADRNGFDRTGWPGGNHLGDHLLVTLSDLWPEYNVRVTYRRKADIRQYTLNWIDPDPVIRELIQEGRMTQDDATGACFASPDEGDLVEEDELGRDLPRDEDPLPPFTWKPRW